MNLKEKLLKLKDNLFNFPLPYNRDYEFEAELEDHELGSQNIYRLHYTNYHRIGEPSNQNNLGIIDCHFNHFLFQKA